MSAISVCEKPVRGTRVRLECQLCQSTFTRLLCQLGRGRGKYCSTTCRSLAWRSGSELRCELCDSPFYRSLSEQDVGEKNRQFCSRDCYAEWRDANRSPSTYPKDGARHLHRVVAESVIGRPLTSDEVVHHIDGNKRNVSPDNIALFPNQSHHMRCHGGSMSPSELDTYRLARFGGESA